MSLAIEWVGLACFRLWQDNRPVLVMDPSPSHRRGMTPVEVFLKRRPRDPVVHVRHHTVPLPPPRLSTRRPTLVVLEPSGYRTGSLESKQH